MLHNGDIIKFKKLNDMVIYIDYIDNHSQPHYNKSFLKIDREFGASVITGIYYEDNQIEYIYRPKVSNLRNTIDIIMDYCKNMDCDLGELIISTMGWQKVDIKNK